MKPKYRLLCLLLIFALSLPIVGCKPKNNASINATNTLSADDTDNPASTDVPGGVQTTDNNPVNPANPANPANTDNPTQPSGNGNNTTPGNTDINISTQQWISSEIAFASAYQHPDTAIIADGAQSTFESSAVPAGWETFGGGSVALSSFAHSGNSSLCLTGRTYTWTSPSINIYSYLKANGAGTYTISFWLYADKLSASPSNGSILIRGNAADVNTFIKKSGTNYFGYIASGISTAEKTWTQYTAILNVLGADIDRSSGTFNLVIDSLSAASGQLVYIDDFKLMKNADWSPLDTTLDVIFTSESNARYVVPAFWDGGSLWKVRFAPPTTGNWTITTSCSDASDTGLHNRTGSLRCDKYTGSLDIYKHGFLTVSTNKRYFTYADDTPFFYLGDTHWSLPKEPIDTSEVPGIASQFKYIIDKRVEQGFTVIQSEPIGANYDLSNGFSQSDLAGFRDLDRRFQYIAEKGLVHANAELFFASELGANGSKYPDAYLEKLCRYWVARYSAYPVMWTIAQEVDNDFYHNRLDADGKDMNPYYDAATNPWKKVAEWVNKYDPYKHPLSAHQEYASMSAEPSKGVNATKSSFKNVPGHNWYAAQWSPAKISQLDFSLAKDFWNSEITKPTVNYEGCYDHLWTLEYGARQQGWTAYLNGMYGQGYGAIDIWYYNSSYNADVDTKRDGITVTVADKHIKWYDSINFPAAVQLGYMHNFFNQLEWWNLAPRFDDTNYFSNNGSLYSVASKGSDVYVAYFYNSTTKTGTIKGLSNEQYTVSWYNPRNGMNYSSITVGITNGSYTIGDKPDGNDWVLVLKKN